MLKVVLGIIIGATLSATLLGYQHTPQPLPQACDRTEESKLRIVLEECSRAVMECTWGPENMKEEE